MGDLQQSLAHDGFALIPSAIPQSIIDRLSAAVEPLLAHLTRVQGGVRDVFSQVPEVREFARSPEIRRWVEPILGSDCGAVNCTLFDKADGRNWKVPYHQDITVRVKRRIEVPGWETWWEKAGVPHVWPPAQIVEGMLAVRVHLDDCGPENGPLRVLPGSHRSGVLSSEEIEAWKEKSTEVPCLVDRGGVILMRPLLLHASSSATLVNRRRVLHIEYAPRTLPDSLEWYEIH
jgi:hypothetical protein